MVKISALLTSRHPVLLQLNTDVLLPTHSITSAVLLLPQQTSTHIFSNYGLRQAALFTHRREQLLQILGITPSR